MTTKHDTQESSVVLAFAELNRLERDRADFVSAKRATSERLAQQASELDQLRQRLVTERPNAWARVRNQHAERRMIHERALTELAAETEALHHARLACYQVDLEAKRLRLAAIESTPIIERPGRRILEWSIPAAATALVAFLGFTFIGEEDAVARTADPVDPIALSDVQDPAASDFDEPEPEPEPEPEAELEIEPEPEPEPELAPTKPSKPKPTKVTKPKPTKVTKPAPTDTTHSKPLKIGDFNGNPLG